MGDLDWQFGISNLAWDFNRLFFFLSGPTNLFKKLNFLKIQLYLYNKLHVYWKKSGPSFIFEKSSSFQKLVFEWPGFLCKWLLVYERPSFGWLVMVGGHSFLLKTILVWYLFCVRSIAERCTLYRKMCHWKCMVYSNNDWDATVQAGCFFINPPIPVGRGIGWEGLKFNGPPRDR